MKIITQYNQIDKHRWAELAEKSPVTSIFQTEACYRFYASLSFLDAFIFGIEDNEKLVGVMVGYVQQDGGKFKRFLSKRAIVNGGLLLAENASKEAVMTLLEVAKRELKKKAIYIELRNLKDYSRWQSVIQDAGYTYEEHLGYIVDTPSEEEVLMNIEKRRRQTIRAAYKEGVIVDTNPTHDDLAAFYALLDEMYKTRVKTPLYPFEFFEKLAQQKFGRFFIVKNGEKVIGGQICMVQEGKTVYDLFLTGNDREYRKLAPSAIGTYSSIQYAANNGYQCCDLMGAGKPREKYGVRDFKESFRGRLVEYGRNHCVCQPILYSIGKFGVKILKKL